MPAKIAVRLWKVGEVHGKVFITYKFGNYMCALLFAIIGSYNTIMKQNIEIPDDRFTFVL